MEALDVVSALIGELTQLQSFMVDAGLAFLAPIAAAVLLLGLSARIAMGAGGSLGYVIEMLIRAGLIGMAIAAAPAITSASLTTAQQIAEAAGGSISAMDVLQRGADWHAALLAHAEAGSIWDGLNAVAMFLALQVAGLAVLVAHLWVSLILALSILMFHLGAAFSPLIAAWAIIPGLQGVGLAALVWFISGAVRLAAVGVVIAAGRAVFLDLAVPSPDESIVMGDAVGAALASLVVAVLAWQASSWAGSVSKFAPGGTGTHAMFATAMGVGGIAGMGGGAGAAGGAARGAAAAGGGAGGGAAGAGAGAARAAQRAGAGVGRQNTP